MTNSRVTMAAIAKRAGVHVTTVSAALRNHRSLPLSTRQRIQALAKRMGYRPDPALAALVAYRCAQHPRKQKVPLAYITNWHTIWGWKEVPAHAEFFAGATDRAAELGYKLEHFWLGAPGLSHFRLSDILFERGIAGLMFASHLRQFERPLQLNWSKFAAVKIDFSPHQPPLPNITNDQRAAIQTATERVIAAGYRRIGCVMPTWWDDFVDRAWSAGFLAEQQRIPARDRIPMLVYADPGDHYLVSRSQFESWYRQHRPDAIISYAPFVRPHFQALGLAVPDDVAFVDIFLTPDDHATAGIRQNCHRVGAVAVEMLVGQLQQYTYGLPAFATSTLVEGTWVDGTSLPSRRTTAESVTVTV